MSFNVYQLIKDSTCPKKGVSEIFYFYPHEVKNNEIRPNYSGKGIGNYLLNIVLSDVRLNGYKSTLLTIDKNFRDMKNNPQDFYIKNGFIPLKESRIMIKYLIN